jgi:hypothetical protein
MGFYFEMEKRPSDGAVLEYTEGRTPGVFWALYVFLGFALVCMGLAAYALLGDLFRSGEWFDKALVWLLYACAPLYLLVGLWLGLVRKFVRAESGALQVGRRFGKGVMWRKTMGRETIEGIALINRKPAENYATRLNDDTQYHIKGHWRVVAWKKGGGAVTLDKHTEKELLAGMERELTAWLKET